MSRRAVVDRFLLGLYRVYRILSNAPVGQGQGAAMPLSHRKTFERSRSRPVTFASLLAATLCAVGGCASCQSSGGKANRWDSANEASTLLVVDVDEPVRSSRVWTTALAPNKRGGWNFIAQAYEYQSTKQAEFVVVDLATGEQKTFPGPSGVYSNSNYQVAEQLRARNGRVFFPQTDTWMAYYEPSDETVKTLGPIVPKPSDDMAIYRAVFGPDGKLYGGTQSRTKPAVFVLDPDTLSYKLIARVGTPRKEYSYAYFVAPDPPWLYVVVGESPWELIAIDMRTNQQTVLATRDSEGFIELEVRPQGIRATLINHLHSPNRETQRIPCVDGKLAPNDSPSPAQFAARKTGPLWGPLERAPQVDVSALTPNGKGVGRIKFRRGPSDKWGAKDVTLTNTEPVEIESLAALPDGSLLGNARQYHGFFRYSPRTKTSEALGTLGLSGGPRVVVDGHVYMSGYPSGSLFDYDPSKPWTAEPTPNPAPLGAFAEADAHYGYFLVPSRNGRLYYAGRRERTGTGGGVGWYDLSSKKFGGHHAGLDKLSPQGFAVVDDAKVVVYAGRDLNEAGQGEIVLYNDELGEFARVPVIPGLSEAGELFNGGSKAVVGVIASKGIVYRFDVAQRTVGQRVDLDGPITATTQRNEDGSIWLVSNGVLRRLDPKSMQLRSFGRLPTPDVQLLTWQGDRLFASRGSNLVEITPP